MHPICELLQLVAFLTYMLGYPGIFLHFFEALTTKVFWGLRIGLVHLCVTMWLAG